MAIGFSQDKLGWFRMCVESMYIPRVINGMRKADHDHKLVRDVEFAVLYSKDVQEAQSKEELFMMAKVTPGEFWPVTPRSAYRLMAAAEYLQSAIDQDDFKEQYGYSFHGDDARAKWKAQGPVEMEGAGLDPLRDRSWYFGLRDCFTKIAQRIAAGNKPHPKTHAELWASCLLFEADHFLMDSMGDDDEACAQFDALPEHPCDEDFEITRYALLGPVFGLPKPPRSSPNEDGYEEFGDLFGDPKCIYNLPEKPTAQWFDPLPRDYFKVTPRSGADASSGTSGGSSNAPLKWDAHLDSSGWRGWPTVELGNYGLVYVVPEKKFAYYDDDEDEDECVVYFGMPLVSPNGVYALNELRKPPFEGEYTAM